MTVGEIAHIHAHSPGGARHDPSLSTSEADSYDNCILLCRPHHRVVDEALEDFPAETLREWKRRHEARFLPDAEHYAGWLASAPPLAQVFVDRPDVQREILEGLSETAPLILVGMSGSGKTQSAVRLMESGAETYTLRLWVRASTRESAAADLAALAPLVGVQPAESEATETVARHVTQRLEQTGGWLLVIDDVPAPEVLLGLLPSGGDVLITTQNAGWSGAGKILRIPRLTAQEAHAITEQATSAVDDEAASELAELCEFLPIAVAQVSSYLATTGSPAHKLLQLLRKERAQILERGSADPHATLAASVNQTVQVLSTDALALLRMLSLLAPVPFDLRPRNHSEEDPDDPLRSALVMEDALAQLRAFSLVEREGETVAAHALIQELAREGMRGSEDEAVAAVRAADAVYDQLPERTGAPEEWPTLELLVPHVEALRRLIPNIEALPGSALAFLLNRLATYYAAIGEAARAEATVREALDLCGPDPTETDEIGLRGSLLNNLANMLRHRGDLIGAREAAEEAIRLKEQAHGPDDLLVGIACGALAAVHEAGGDFAAARPLHERALRIHRLAGDHRRAAAALLDLAAIAEGKQDSQAALELARGAVALADAPDYWIELVRAHVTIAEILERRGEFQDALDASQAAVVAAEGVGIETEYLGRALSTQARILDHQGSPLALPTFERALDTHRSCDRRGVATATAQGDYGAALFLRGRQEEGLAQLRASEEWLESHRPASDDILARGRLMLARAYIQASDPYQARLLLERVASDAANPPSAAEARTLLGELGSD